MAAVAVVGGVVRMLGTPRSLLASPIFSKRGGERARGPSRGRGGEGTAGGVEAGAATLAEDKAAVGAEDGAATSVEGGAAVGGAAVGAVAVGAAAAIMRPRLSSAVASGIAAAVVMVVVVVVEVEEEEASVSAAGDALFEAGGGLLTAVLAACTHGRRLAFPGCVPAPGLLAPPTGTPAG